MPEITKVVTILVGGNGVIGTGEEQDLFMFLLIIDLWTNSKNKILLKVETMPECED